jgi:hypothetical protein
MTPYVAAPKKVLCDVTTKINLHSRRIPTDTPTRTSFQWFTSILPLSSFEKLVLSTSRLLHGLHTMSLTKAVPVGIRDKECERFALCKSPPVLYVPEKDPIRETVSALKSNQSLKTTIGNDAELCIQNWHAGMRKAFLMHVSTALKAIKKWGTFKAYREASELYVKHRKAVKQAKAALALVNATASKGEKNSKKASQKPKEGAAPADAIAPELHKECEKDLEKARLGAETAKNKKESTAKEMFQFYANLLSLDTKYAWNKIVKEQTEMDPYKDLQGVSRKGPRGLWCKSFDDCVMFHLLSVFSNNAAEQEKYYLSNVLKKPQRAGVPQFVQCIEQLNAYVP